MSFYKHIDLIIKIEHSIVEFQCWFMKKLERQGGQESLQSMVERVEHKHHQILSDLRRSEQPQPPPSDTASKSARLKEISRAHLLVAALIATVTFTAAFTIPGGFDGSHGTAVMWKRPYFGVFAVADSVSFFCATAAVLLNFVMSVEQNYHLVLRFAKMAAFFTYLSLFGMVVAFTSGLRVVLPADSNVSVYTLVSGAFFLFLFSIGFL